MRSLLFALLIMSSTHTHRDTDKHPPTLLHTRVCVVVMGSVFHSYIYMRPVCVCSAICVCLFARVCLCFLFIFIFIFISIRVCLFYLCFLLFLCWLLFLLLLLFLFLFALRVHKLIEASAKCQLEIVHIQHPNVNSSQKDSTVNRKKYSLINASLIFLFI